MQTALFDGNIIQSMLDLDVYKINMMSAVHGLYPDAVVRYELIVRSDEDLSGLYAEVRHEVSRLADYRFTDEQLCYLAKVAPYLPHHFLAYLRTFRFDPQQQVQVRVIERGDNQRQLGISICGYWCEVILYETMVMSIVSEVRNRRDWSEIAGDQFHQVLRDKVRQLKSKLAANQITNFRFSEMGTRRRFSAPVHRDVLTYLHHEVPHLLLGTSNYHLAHQMNLTPIGTVAHEWFMAHQALVRVQDSQRIALEQWHRYFSGALGIALTDTIGIDAFLKDFDLSLSQAYAGVRHDSGSPIAWGERMVAHYQRMGINPAEKSLIFTDALDFDRALEICSHFAGRAQVGFGIGTFLTNDMGVWHNAQGECYNPLSIVVKMAECNGLPVAKISDEPRKAMCEDDYFLANIKQRFGVAA